MLLGAKISLNLQLFDTGFSLGHTAICNEHTNILQLLLERKINPNSKDKYSTLAHTAVAHSHSTMVSLLIDHKADINVPIDGTSHTCAHLAAEEGQCDILQLLADAKADLTRKNDIGKKPIAMLKSDLSFS